VTLLLREREKEGATKEKKRERARKEKERGRAKKDRLYTKQRKGENGGTTGRDIEEGRK
jgi:hypothetical protein